MSEIFIGMCVLFGYGVLFERKIYLQENEPQKIKETIITKED